MLCTFEMFATAHWLVLIATIILAVIMVRYFRSSASEASKQKTRYIFGSLLILAVLMDPVLAFSRYGFSPTGWDVFWGSSLPLYLCDVVSICAAIALITKNVYLTEISYLWGVAGTTQGLLTPTLRFGPETLDFYNFFLQHAGVPIAAACLIWGMRILPQKGAFKRALIWSWLYLIIVFTINFLSGQNYGFLNHKPNCATMFDYMGPYPYYLITLQVIAFSLYAILLKLAPKSTVHH